MNALLRLIHLLQTALFTLPALLRTIHYLRRRDQQRRDGLAIAKQAGNLYDKFVGFTEAVENIGLLRAKKPSILAKGKETTIFRTGQSRQPNSRVGTTGYSTWT